MNTKLLKECIRQLVLEVVSKRDPEYADVDTFAQFMSDDDREEYNHEDLVALNFRTNLPVQVLRKKLEAYGLKLATRPVEKQVRGFNTSSNDRWYGPGSMATHGGAGIEASTGRANAKGTV